MKNRLIIKLLFLAFLFIGCNSNPAGREGSPAPDKENPWVSEKRITCVYDGVPVYKGPDASVKGSWLTSVKLGEMLTYLDESKSDTGKNKREYFKVKLSDGTTGWALSYGLVLYSKPGIVIQESRIFARPDALSLTGKSLEPMEIVAITNVKENWVEITSEMKKQKGWIENSDISENPDDILTGVLFQKTMKSKDGRKEQEKISGFLKDPPSSESIFIGQIQSMLDSLTGETPVDTISAGD